MNRILTCEMHKDCSQPVSMIEDKGYVYCAEHGVERRSYGRRCRKLRPWELRLLRTGEPLPSYRPLPRNLKP